MCLTIDELRGLCTPDNIYLTLHASKRLEQRGIPVSYTHLDVYKRQLCVSSSCSDYRYIQISA